MPRQNGIIKLWGFPFLLFVLTLFGLVMSLATDGIGDIIYAGSLLIPNILIVWYLYRKQKR